ncbi:hypothetical protein HRbin17_02037 [bacterium HR17]|uniref:Uncharacterized protein n=1 Tax=Candidatus Fervidibacter japonicus TaxID=2035412 RepID=A0A2H5XEB0_9BACT|nr:hypothetical protein HRbin17_02037 [bacterium HR17]
MQRRRPVPKERGGVTPLVRQPSFNKGGLREIIAPHRSAAVPDCKDSRHFPHLTRRGVVEIIASLPRARAAGQG